MSEESLKALVGRLRSELAQAHDLKGDTRDELHGLAREVEAALEDAGSSVSGNSTALHDRLTDWVRELEVSHPRLSMTIGNIVDTLAFYGL